MLLFVHEDLPPSLLEGFVIRNEMVQGVYYSVWAVMADLEYRCKHGMTSIG